MISQPPYGAQGPYITAPPAAKCVYGGSVSICEYADCRDTGKCLWLEWRGLPALAARIAALEAERAEARAERDRQYDYNVEQIAKFAALEAERDELVAALQWIADYDELQFIRKAVRFYIGNYLRREWRGLEFWL